MQNSIMRMVFIMLGGYLLIRYRYQLMNTLLGNTWIRKMAISTAMQMPFFRDKMMRQIL